MGVSKTSGTPKSLILIGFAIINHPFWGTPIFWKQPYSYMYIYMSIRMICRMNPSDQDMGLELLTFRTLVRGFFTLDVTRSSTRMSWEGWWKLTGYFFLGCWIIVMATVCIGIFRKLVVFWVATIWELDPVPSWGSKVCFFWGGR